MSAKQKPRCHLCAREAKLEDEHFPPKSAGNDQWIWAHTMRGMEIGAAQGITPPPLEYPGGMKRKSLCKPCNWRTQEWYNAAFKIWTTQARAVMPDNADTASIDVEFKGIEPLSIMKQVLTGALAAADFAFGLEAEGLRREVLNRFEQGLPFGVKVLTYLNPPRLGEIDDHRLTTKRVCWNQPQIDIVTGKTTFTFAEYAHSPLGYVVLFTTPPFGISDTAAELADLSFFADYRWQQKADVKLRLPVRNPFGPVSCHFAIISDPGKWYKNEVDARAGRES